MSALESYTEVSHHLGVQIKLDNCMSPSERCYLLVDLNLSILEYLSCMSKPQI